MKKKQAKPIWLDAEKLATVRMQAINVAANLRDAEGNMQGLGGSGGYMRPGKTAEQVVSAAEKIMAFITKA